MDARRKTEFEQQYFFNDSLERYRQASAKLGAIKYFYRLAETIVCLEFAGETMVPFFTPALAHLKVDPVEKPDALFCIWDTESSGIEMTPPPCTWTAFTDRGDIWGFNSKRIRTAWHWGEFSVNIMDLETNTAVFWVKTSKTIPYWSVSSPLRTLFHWWMEKNGAQLLHAAAIGNKDGAVLVTGRGGVGKSTTALSCLDAGMAYLADDYLFVMENPEPRVFSLYSTAKLVWDDLHKFPNLAPYIAEPIRKNQEKAILFLYPELQNRIVNDLPIKAILTPEFSDKQESSIAEVPFWTIQGNMSFTTMSQLPYAGKYTHEYVNRLCRRLPIYTLKLGRDHTQIPAALTELLKDPASYQRETSKSVKEVVGPLPLITVIMPVYNGEAFIAEAIENILSQDYPALEIIIVNDGSTDQTEEIIKGLPVDIRYFRQDNAGPAAARNRGIRDASGEFLAFLDVDDLWPENHLYYLLREMQNDPSLLVVHGYAQVMELNEESGEYEYKGNPEESFPGFIGAGLYRREAFSKVGLYDPQMRFGEDADWFHRAGEMDIPLIKLKEVTLFVRRHGGNMTQGKTLVELNALKVLKKSLDRGRGKEFLKGLENKPILPISVIIPVYNAEKYIGEAIESIFTQDAIPKEVIVVDDGSVDGSVRLAESYPPPVKVNRQKNKGAAAARNAGIELSHEDFLAFLDADDVWMPGMPELLLKTLKEEPELDMVFGMVEQFISPELEEHQRAHLREELKTMPGYLMGAMLIRRASFDKVGLLNEELQLAEFIDWLSKAELKGLKHKVIDQVVMRRRLHTTNQGILKKDNMQDYAAVARAALQRKRESQ